MTNINTPNETTPKTITVFALATKWAKAERELIIAQHNYRPLVLCNNLNNRANLLRREIFKMETELRNIELRGDNGFALIY